jgi:hypothetical protein
MNIKQRLTTMPLYMKIATTILVALLLSGGTYLGLQYLHPSPKVTSTLSPVTNTQPAAHIYTQNRETIWQETFETGNEWSGTNSNIQLLTSGNAAARITGAPKSDGYLFRKMTIPAGTQYMTYDIKDEKVTKQSFLTVSFGKEIMDHHSLAVVDDGFAKSNEVFFGDKAGQTDDLLFAVNQVGDELPSVLIDNITFYRLR